MWVDRASCLAWSSDPGLLGSLDLCGVGEGYGPQGGPSVGSRNRGQRPAARLEVSLDSSFD